MANALLLMACGALERTAEILECWQDHYIGWIDVRLSLLWELWGSALLSEHGSVIEVIPAIAL